MWPEARPERAPCSETGAGSIPRATPQDLDPLLVLETVPVHADLRPSAGHLPPPGPEPRILPGVRPRVHGSWSGAIPPPVSRWKGQSGQSLPSKAAQGQTVESWCPAGFVVPSDFGSDGGHPSMTTEQEHHLELEIRMLEEQLGGSSPQSRPISPAAPVAVPQLPRNVEKPRPAATAQVAAPRAFVSEYAHLTRSEYIKLKAKLRGAAQMIQSKAKTFLLRRYLSGAERLFALQRIQGSCRTFLAKAMLQDGRRRKQFRFVLLVAQCQARFRRRLRRKREEEARQWEESLGKLQRQAITKVQAKSRSFLALLLLLNQRLALRRRGSAASLIQRSCRVHLSRLQALERLAVVNEQERLRLRAVLRLQTLLKGMRARQELTHLRIQNDEDERRRRRLLEDEEEIQIEELNPEPMWPDLSLEERLQALWEHVLAQQHEQARREEEVKRLKKLLTQQRVDKDFQPNCWSCDQQLLDLDALLRGVQRICLAAMGGDTPGTRPEKAIVGKVASTLTAVVNEIEEAGGKVTVQLKELAAYLAWVSVHSSSAARRLDNDA